MNIKKERICNENIKGRPMSNNVAQGKTRRHVNRALPKETIGTRLDYLYNTDPKMVFYPADKMNHAYYRGDMDLIAHWCLALYVKYKNIKDCVTSPQFKNVQKRRKIDTPFVILPKEFIQCEKYTGVVEGVRYSISKAALTVAVGDNEAQGWFGCPTNVVDKASTIIDKINDTNIVERTSVTLDSIKESADTVTRCLNEARDRMVNIGGTFTDALCKGFDSIFRFTSYLLVEIMQLVAGGFTFVAVTAAVSRVAIIMGVADKLRSGVNVFLNYLMETMKNVVVKEAGREDVEDKNKSSSSGAGGKEEEYEMDSSDEEIDSLLFDDGMPPNVAQGLENMHEYCADFLRALVAACGVPVMAINKSVDFFKGVSVDFLKNLNAVGAACRAAVFIQSFFNSLISPLLDYITSWWNGTPNLSALSAMEKEVVNRDLASVNKVCDPAILNDYNTSALKRGMVYDLRRDLAHKQSRLPTKDRNLNTQMVGLYNTMIARVDKVVSYLQDKGWGSNEGIRQLPTTVFLKGMPGVGKSTLTDELAQMIALVERVDYKDIREVIYKRTTEKYWSGYRSQLVTEFDDFGSLVDLPGNPNPNYTDLLNIYGTSPMPLDMADVTSKGNTYFQSKMIIASLNVDAAAHSLTNKSALNRRKDIVVNVFNVKHEHTHLTVAEAGGQQYYVPNWDAPIETRCDYRRYFVEKVPDGFEKYKGKTLDHRAFLILVYRLYMKRVNAVASSLDNDRKIKTMLQDLIDNTSPTEPTKLSRNQRKKKNKKNSKKEDSEDEDSDSSSEDSSEDDDFVPPKPPDRRSGGDNNGPKHDGSNGQNDGVEVPMEGHDYGFHEEPLSAIGECAVSAWQNALSLHNIVGMVCGLLGGLLGVGITVWAYRNKGQMFYDKGRKKTIRTRYETPYDAHHFPNLESYKQAVGYTQTGQGAEAKDIEVFNVDTQEQIEFHDTPETLIMRKISRNQYMLEVRDGDDWIKTGEVTVVTGNCVLFFRHGWDYITRSSGKFRLRHCDEDVPREFSVADCKYVNVGDDSKLSDAILITIPGLYLHKGIVQLFADADSLAHTSITSYLVGHFETNRQTWINVGTPELYNTECGYQTKSGRHVVKGYAVYGYPTQKGHCGSLLFVDSKNLARKLVGIHVCGNGVTGTSFLITRQMLMNALDRVPDPCKIESLDIEGFSDLLCTDVEIVCSDARIVLYRTDTGYGLDPISKGPMVNRPTDTTLRHSPLHGNVFNEPGNEELKLLGDKKQPCKLRPFTNDEGDRVDPYRMATRKMRDGLNDIPIIEIEDCCQQYFAKHKVIVPSKPYTIEEAVNGIDGEDYFDSVNRTTSSGFYGKLNPKKGAGKVPYLGTFDNLVIDDELRSRVSDIIEKARENKRVPVPYVDFLKDERLSKKKVDEGRTRPVSASSLDYLLAFRMYFGPYMCELMKNRIGNGIAVGVDPHSHDWDELGKRLQSKSKLIVAGDFGDYDRSLQRSVLHVIGCFVIDIIGGTKDERRVRSVLWASVSDSWHLVDGIVYAWTHGLPSGNPITALVNSLYNLIANRMAYKRLANKNDPKLVDGYDDNVYMIAYGDDNVINVSNKVSPWFNQISLAEVYKGLGLKYTMEDKSEATQETRELKDVTFLKRDFKFDGVWAKRWVAPLSKETIVTSIQWMRKSEVDTGDFPEMVYAMQLEAALHGANFYGAFGSSVHKAMLRAKLPDKGERLRWKVAIGRLLDITAPPDCSIPY